jgi:RNA polymerase sigma factor (sigma-70 family)
LETPHGEANSFRDLIKKVHEGSSEAFHRVIEQYGGHVYRAVRRRLNRRMRSKFDSGGFVQAVWASFFEKRQQLGSFHEPAQLIGFLGQVASNKVVDECRRRLRAKRYDIRREQPIEDEVHAHQLIANSPTPSAVAIADEQLDLLVRNQRETHLQMLRLRTMGATFAEIAARIGVGEKTVQRVLKRMSRRIVQ